MKSKQKAPGLGAGGLFLAALVIVAGLFSKTPALQPMIIIAATVGLFSLFRVRGNMWTGILAWLLTFSFLAAATTSLMAPGGIEYGARGTLALVYPILCAVAAAVIWDRASPASRRLVKFALGAIIVGNMVVALRQAIFGLTAAEVAEAIESDSTYLVGEQVRLMATFATNQDFGLFLSASLPATLAVALMTKSRRLRIGSWLMTLVIAVVIVLSLTRTALVAAAVAAVVLIFLWARGSATTRIIKGTVTISVVGGIAVFFFSAIDAQRFQDAVARFTTLFDLYEDRSFNARADVVLPRAIAAVGENPLGYGAGAAGPVSQQFPEVAPLGGFTTDNGYLMFAAQIGIHGALGLTLLLLTVMVFTRRGRTVASVAAAGVICAFLVALFFAQYWSLLAPVTFAAVVVGIGVAQAGGVKPKVSTLTKPGMESRV